MWPFSKRKLSDYNDTLAREKLIQGARLVFIDDETPLLIEALQKVGFSVDHDTNGENLSKYDNQIYDVAIIDYHGVGRSLGEGQGLELIKYILRVSPRTRIVAYTSRSLSATESEFFRLSHEVLRKDIGLRESLALIENEIRKAFDKEYLFGSLVTKLAMANADDTRRMQRMLIKALSNKDETKFKEYVSRFAGTIAEKSVEIIISKLFV